MKFTKLIASLLVLVLVGCASEPVKKSKIAQGAAAPSVAAAGTSILPAGPVTPNPYLQNKPSVSRQAQQNFTDATRAMRNKQWAQAESLLQKVLAENNKLSGAYLNLGLVYRAQKEDKRAEQAFNDAIAANHTNLDAYNQLAILQREAGNFSGAETNYKKALSLWPFHPESHKNIAILYDLYMGKSTEALPHYEAYLQLLGGEDKQATSWIADLQRRLGIAPKPKAAASADEVPTETTTETPAEEVSDE
ncbi:MULTISPECIES: tetratricopeptide repeat protein [Cellvibrio]|uniref:Tetratricopeptide (TPR) repeat protein n=1 Tax=Cellvibrio fibrivorans TaxID=126350 RepID=A0ABU1V1N2_9GAMM|nr:tetratricopeptide repeat protein [Cellvibrio fibrivorans]MDR7091315.1 tetratricopeptide (TPR) repeat protein [Cellvibrio fibrivorans]